MAHKKAGGATHNVHDSPGQRLGIKLFGGQKVTAGNIIARQRGTKYHQGTGVGLGKDHTIYALRDGTVKFSQKRKTRFDGRRIRRTLIHVV